MIANFDGDSYGEWTIEGEAFGTQPARGSIGGQMHVSGFHGPGLINSFWEGDQTTGLLTSPEFEITRDFLCFLAGGGNHPDEVGMELLIGGERKRVVTGRDSEQLLWRAWDVSEFKGQRAQLRIFDRATGGWGHVLIDDILLSDDSLETPVVGRIEDYRKSATYYRERYRPQFHFTPEINWMNDPNGLVYFDGEYHLFFQHNPHGNEWGHMSWGHAVSTDLLHWKHLPIALQDEYGTMIFSGSAVVDHQNTSGFGDGKTPPLIAIYTGHGHGRQSQDIAYSNDHGRTWTKYPGNPVLDIDESEFRDPKVFWHAPSNRWVMVVTLAAQKRLQFYGSPNLKEWTLLSEFGPAGVANKPNWECPDLFELPVEGEPGQTRWVLEADMGSGSIAGGSGGEYFVGSFDGTTFSPETEDSQWVDFGRDFYAPVSWSNVPIEDGRRLWLGWMNNWETSLNPTHPWRSAMSIPRELSLRRVDGKLRLIQRPVRELEGIRGTEESLKDFVLNDDALELKTHGQQLEIRLSFTPGSEGTCGLNVCVGENQKTAIWYDAQAKTLNVDRSQSGDVGFHQAFAGTYSAPLSPQADGTVSLQILVDACSVEVFGNDGAISLTNLIFPSRRSDGIKLFAAGSQVKIHTLAVAPLATVWPQGLTQQASVRPGINDSFRDPNVNDFVGRFETESREVFAQRKEIVAALELKPGMTIADVGAGTGLFTRLFAEAVGNEGQVLAVDISQKFVDHILSTSREAGLTQVRGIVCTDKSSMLPANSVDVIYICDTYHHFEFPQLTLASLHQALRPGGKLVVIDFHRIEGKSSDFAMKHVRAGQEVFTSEIVQAGFAVEKEVPLLKENYFLVFKKQNSK